MLSRSAFALGAWLWLRKKGEKGEAKGWIYRDDIGAYWGIKGYEEQVTEVGTHRGKMHWPNEGFLGTFNAGSVRRGFQVFTRNCANCHGMMYRKYDFVLDKGYRQLELAAIVSNFTINPAHHHYKQYYYQEWSDRDRVISDPIYPPYYSQDQAKAANGGVWPTDLSKIRFRPGGHNYIYNILTGYHFSPPAGMDVPRGKHFNPYFDHMIIGMARQLHDGMIDYDDGTPASTPQMAYDVANFIAFMQRRNGAKNPDKRLRNGLIALGVLLMYPVKHVVVRGALRNMMSYRAEAYAVRDGVYYKHFRSGQVNYKSHEHSQGREFWY